MTYVMRRHAGTWGSYSISLNAKEHGAYGPRRIMLRVQVAYKPDSPAPDSRNSCGGLIRSASGRFRTWLCRLLLPLPLPLIYSNTSLRVEDITSRDVCKSESFHGVMQLDHVDTAAPIVTVEEELVPLESPGAPLQAPCILQHGVEVWEQYCAWKEPRKNCCSALFDVVYQEEKDVAELGAGQRCVSDDHCEWTCGACEVSPCGFGVIYVNDLRQVQQVRQKVAVPGREYLEIVQSEDEDKRERSRHGQYSCT